MTPAEFYALVEEQWQAFSDAGWVVEADYRPYVLATDALDSVAETVEVVLGPVARRESPAPDGGLVYESTRDIRARSCTMPASVVKRSVFELCDDTLWRVEECSLEGGGTSWQCRCVQV